MVSCAPALVSRGFAMSRSEHREPGERKTEVLCRQASLWLLSVVASEMTRVPREPKRIVGSRLRGHSREPGEKEANKRATKQPMEKENE